MNIYHRAVDEYILSLRVKIDTNYNYEILSLDAIQTNQDDKLDLIRCYPCIITRENYLIINITIIIIFYKYI